MAKKKRNRRTKRELEGVERTPSGQISRARTPSKKTDPRLVGIWARIRHFGVSSDNADQPEAGTAVGRAWLKNRITTSQHDAAKKWVEIHARYAKALQTPDALASTDKTTADPNVSEEYVEWATKAVAEYETHNEALRDIGVATAVHRCVIIDSDIDLVGFVAVSHGLNRLSTRLGIVRQNVAQKVVDKSPKV